MVSIIQVLPGRFELFAGFGKTRRKRGAGERVDN